MCPPAGGHRGPDLGLTGAGEETETPVWRRFLIDWTHLRDYYAGAADPEKATRFLDICERADESPNGVMRRWAYWHGIHQRDLPPAWPKFISPEYWDSLVLFAENEYLGKRI